MYCTFLFWLYYELMDVIEMFIFFKLDIHYIKMFDYLSALVMCPTLSHTNILFVPHLVCWDLVTLNEILVRYSEILPRSLFNCPDAAADALLTSPYVLDLPYAGLAPPCNQAYLPELSWLKLTDNHSASMVSQEYNTSLNISTKSPHRMPKYWIYNFFSLTSSNFTSYFP